jgi:hypothetical protein
VNHGSQITSVPNFASIFDRVNDSVYRVKDHHVKSNEKSTQINKLSILSEKQMIFLRGKVIISIKIPHLANYNYKHQLFTPIENL